jgi:glycosyltransferase involved in cell wall biosynthesis
MKIVLPVHHFPPRYSAGAELYTLRLARWLLAHGHEAEVVCVERTDDAAAQPLAAWRDEYQAVPVWRLALNLAQAPDPFAWSYNNPAIGSWFAGYLADTQPDIVHLQSGYLVTASVLAAARARGCPTIVTLHDFWFVCPRITLLRGDGRVCAGPPADPGQCAWCMRLEGRRYRLPDSATGGLAGKVALRLAMSAPRQEIAARRRFLDQELRQAAAVIAPSHFMARMFEGRVREERLRVLRVGLDASAPPPSPYQPEPNRLRLGYIGQIAAHKGVHVLIEAVRRLPLEGRQVELSVYGDMQQHAGYGPRLRRLIGDDLRIQLAGRFDNRQVGAVLGQFDALVVPSIWYENSPLAIMEAQAAGLPVLTSALGGISRRATPPTWRGRSSACATTPRCCYGCEARYSRQPPSTTRCRRCYTSISTVSGR